jgi:hypothetical protein
VNARVRHAQLGSDCATARLQGMKLRASLDPPRAAEGTFPYPARTCAEWDERHGAFVERQMTQAERRRDASQGSRKLRDAIRKVAA